MNGATNESHSKHSNIKLAEDNDKIKGSNGSKLV